MVEVHQTFISSMLTVNTRKRCEICSKFKETRTTSTTSLTVNLKIFLYFEQANPRWEFTILFVS